MNPSPVATQSPSPAAWKPAMQRACDAIAPAWPLDRQIAVNPWWELRDTPMKAVSARLAALAGVRCVPMEEQDGASPAHWLTVSELIDRLDDNRHRIAWQDELVWQISQYLAEHDARHANGACGADAVYRRWREVAGADVGMALATGEKGLHRDFLALPDTVDGLLAQTVVELGVGDHCMEDMALAALLSVNGWASRLAWLRWEAGLAGKDNDLLPALLAMRLGWELVLWRRYENRHPDRFRGVRRHWRRQQGDLAQWVREHGMHQESAWQRLEQAEQAWRAPLLSALREEKNAPGDHADRATPPVMQVVCCIDVRSERLRRALEAQHPGIRTVGFAGFFGLPLQSVTAGGQPWHPQLPGLLAAGLTAVPESGTGPGQSGPVHAAATAAPSMFGAVEAAGIAGITSLLRAALGRSASDQARRAPAQAEKYRLVRDGRELDAAERADLAAGVLRAMGLTGPLAPTVLLTGHGSSSCNNPQAAALDCGACGGQSGALNVRVLAGLLNEEAVRNHLATDHDIMLPHTTRFVPALHDTTTDRIEVLTPDVLTDQERAWLAAAGDVTRQERARRQGIEGDPARRATDASQVRPEWSLAGNAGFIIAPRALTRGMDLDGRCFLHGYDAAEDADGSLLEAILTGPMVVTNWINLQYYASVVDNRHYGSGNKVLHNVVRGNPGVFEGHGGDLRHGLALQSLYNGERRMHEPLRLLVAIDAPHERVEAILDRHAHLRALVDNGWLTLACL